MVVFQLLVTQAKFLKWRIFSCWEAHAARGSSSMHHHVEDSVDGSMWVICCQSVFLQRKVASLCRDSEFRTLNSSCPHANHQATAFPAAYFSSLLSNLILGSLKRENHFHGELIFLSDIREWPLSYQKKQPFYQEKIYQTNDSSMAIDHRWKLD